MSSPLNGSVKKWGGMSVLTLAGVFIGLFLSVSQVLPFTPWEARKDIDANASAIAAHRGTEGHPALARRVDALDARVAWQQQQIEGDMAEVKDELKALRAEIRQLIREVR